MNTTTGKRLNGADIGQRQTSIPGIIHSCKEMKQSVSTQYLSNSESNFVSEKINWIEYERNEHNAN